MEKESMNEMGVDVRTNGGKGISRKAKKKGGKS